MFHRRLLLLSGIMALGFLALLLQTARLTTGAEHQQRRAEAESVLRTETLIPTVRGRIRDRQGRVLAYDDAGWEAAVNYTVLTGLWARRQAESLARRKHRAVWSELSAPERQERIDEEQVAFDEQVEMLWQALVELGDTDRLEIERRKDTIRQRVQMLASHLHHRWWEQKRRELGEDIPFHEAVQTIREERQAHTILPRVSEEKRVLIQSYIADAQRLNQSLDPRSTEVNPMLVWTQVELRRPKQRLYPFETITLELDRSTMPGPLRREEPLEITVEGVARHMLGSMREVWQQDIAGEDARPFRTRSGETDLAGYLPGDLVGHGGIEGYMESRLRGNRGISVRHADTGYEDRLEPQPGGDVHLTIDIQLQARVQAIMTANPTPTWPGLLSKQEWHGRQPDPTVDAAAYRRWIDELGSPLNGAAVILDAETSEVLAAVTMPAMPQRVLDENPKMVWGDTINYPWINRAISRPYPPGSTIKPMMLAAALTEGRHALHDPIHCHGPLDPDKPTQFRCWIFKTYMQSHGPLLGAEAIARSCNVYFYTLGREMGLQRTIEWYRRFGLGERTDCGLGDEEIAGAVGNPRQTYPSDPINMAIGQGPVSWTPMQAAAAYATLARGGLHLPPTLVRDEDRLQRRQAVDLHLDSAAVLEAMHGLDDAVNARHGTGWGIGALREQVITVNGVKVIGKSGTADPGRRRIDRGEEGVEIIEFPGDHAWFVAMTIPQGKTRPTHVIAVVVEYAGSGGQIAGPVVNQIVHAMQQEGYLP